MLSMTIGFLIYWISELLCLAQAIGIFYSTSNPYFVYIFAALIGFNFGGNFALFPIITAETFGTKNVGQTYPWVFLAYGIGGVAFPILGGWLGDMGNFPLAFTVCGVLCIARDSGPGV